MQSWHPKVPTGVRIICVIAFIDEHARQIHLERSD